MGDELRIRPVRLVTNYIKDFSAYPGITIQNWLLD